MLLAMTWAAFHAVSIQISPAQIIVTNGSSVSQQILGANGTLLVEPNGTVSEIDQEAIFGTGTGISAINNGTIETDLASAINSGGSEIGAITISGTNNSIENNGNVSFDVLLSSAGTAGPSSLGSQAALRILGNDSGIMNTGLILATSESPPPVAGCSFLVCIGSVASEVIEATHGIALIGDHSQIQNTGTVITNVNRTTHTASSALLIDGSNNTLINDGDVLVNVGASATALTPHPTQAGRWDALLTDPLNNVYHSGILISGNQNNVVNNGIITADDNRTFQSVLGIDAYFSDPENSQITNNGIITSDNMGIIVANGHVVNTGSIFSGVNSTLFFGAGGVVLAGSTLENYGLIESQTDGTTSEDSLNLGDGPNTIFNYGIIRGGTIGHGNFAGFTTIHNYGDIYGGQNGIQNGGPGGGSPSLSFYNYGNIEGGRTGIESRANNGDFFNAGSISGNDFGIRNTIDEITLTNTGEIFGETAIYSDRQLILDNSGTFYSTDGPTGYAIQIQPEEPFFPGFTLQDPSDDHITLRAGTRIIGRMDLGADSLFALPPNSPNGNDTLVFDRTSPDIAWRWTFDNFDIPGQDPIDQTGFGDSLFILGNNVPYYIWNGPQTGDYGPFPSDDGVTVYIPNISGLFVTNGILEDIARTVHGGIRNRLNEGWDHENLTENLFYREEDDIVLRDGSEIAGAPLETLDPAVFRKAPPLTVWAKGFGGMRHEAGTANYSDYSHVWTGGMVGMDLKVSQGDQNDDGLRDREDDDHWNIGLLGGYVLSDLAFDTSLKEIESDFFFAGTYGRLVRDAYFLDASVIAGFGGMSEAGPIANNLVPGGIEYPGEGYSTNGSFISPSASIGKRFYITDSITFTPEFNATYLAQWIDGHSNPTTFSLEDRFADTVFGHIQGAIKKTIKRENSTIIGELRGGLFMSRQLRGDEVEMTVVDSSFTVDTSRDDIISPYAGIGLTWEIANSFKVSADAEVDFGDLNGGRVRFGGSLGF